MSISLTGILKMSPEGEILETIKALRDRVTRSTGLVGLPDDKLHVTMLHQKLTGPLKGKILPAYSGQITPGQIFTVERPGKRSAFVTLNEQDDLHRYVKGLGVEPEAKRKYHISLGNLTGNPMDSVGHIEDLPIMEGAIPFDFGPALSKRSSYKFASAAGRGIFSPEVTQVAFAKVASKLTAAARARIDEGNFALPGRRYPIHDASHARSALSMVAAHGTADEKARVRAAVARRFPGIAQEKTASYYTIRYTVPGPLSTSPPVLCHDL